MSENSVKNWRKPILKGTTQQELDAIPANEQPVEGRLGFKKSEAGKPLGILIGYDEQHSPVLLPSSDEVDSLVDEKISQIEVGSDGSQSGGSEINTGMTITSSDSLQASQSGDLITLNISSFTPIVDGEHLIYWQIKMPDGAVVTTENEANPIANPVVQVSGASGDELLFEVKPVTNLNNNYKPAQHTVTITSAAPPNVDNATISGDYPLPSALRNGDSGTLTLSGATDADGNAVTYEVETTHADLISLSANANNDEITYTVVSNPDVDTQVTISLYAVDSLSLKTLIEAITVVVKYVDQSVIGVDGVNVNGGTVFNEGRGLYYKGGQYNFSAPMQNYEDYIFNVYLTGSGTNTGRSGSAPANYGDGAGAGTILAKIDGAIFEQYDNIVPIEVGVRSNGFLAAGTHGGDGSLTSFGTLLTAIGGTSTWHSYTVSVIIGSFSFDINNPFILEATGYDGLNRRCSAPNPITGEYTNLITRSQSPQLFDVFKALGNKLILKDDDLAVTIDYGAAPGTSGTLACGNYSGRSDPNNYAQGYLVGKSGIAVIWWEEK